MQARINTVSNAHSAEEVPIAARIVATERQLQEVLRLLDTAAANCRQAYHVLSDLQALMVASDASTADNQTVDGRYLRLLAPGDQTIHGTYQQPPIAGQIASSPLTAREVEVLILIASGHSNKAIARELSLSIRTVERHINNIYRKIDAENKADATAYAFRNGLA